MTARIGARRTWRDLLAPPEFYAERRELAPTRFERVFEPTILIVTVLLFAQGLAQFFLAIAPGWEIAGAMPLGAIVAVVAYLYSRRLARGVIIWREWLVLLAVPIALTRLLPYLYGADLAADVATWTRDPFAFFEVGFLVRTTLLLIVWWQVFASTQDLNDVRLQPGEVSDLPSRTIIERAWESDRLRAIDHTTPYQRLASRFLTSGVILIVVAAMVSANVQQLLTIEAVGQLVTFGRPSSSIALVNVVAFFVAVLLLLAEAQYVRKRTLWQLDRVAVQPGIAARWGSTAGLLVGAGVVAALLAPTEGLLGVGEVVRMAFSALMLVAAFVAVAAYFLFWALTYPLRWLLGTAPDEGPSIPPALPPPVASPPPSDGSLLDLLKSALFWLIALGLLAYTITVLWRQGRLKQLSPGVAWLGERVFNSLVALGAWLRALGWRAAAVALQVGRLIASVRPHGPRIGSPRLAGLLPGRDPRWIVVAIYGMLVVRAGERGLDRRPGQTALEYRQRLRDGVPAAAAEVDSLTDAFVRARYGPRPVERDDASLARRCWGRIRAQLRSATSRR